MTTQFVIFSDAESNHRTMTAVFPTEVLQEFGKAAGLGDAFVESADFKDRGCTFAPMLAEGVANLILQSDHLRKLYPKNAVLPTYDDFVAAVAGLLKVSLLNPTSFVNRISWRTVNLKKNLTPV